VGWRYYALFIATSFAVAFIYFFLLPESKNKSLEEITAATEQLAHINVAENEANFGAEIKHFEKTV